MNDRQKKKRLKIIKQTKELKEWVRKVILDDMESGRMRLIMECKIK